MYRDHDAGQSVESGAVPSVALASPRKPVLERIELRQRYGRLQVGELEVEAHARMQVVAAAAAFRPALVLELEQAMIDPVSFVDHHAALPLVTAWLAENEEVAGIAETAQRAPRG